MGAYISTSNRLFVHKCGPARGYPIGTYAYAFKTLWVYMCVGIRARKLGKQNFEVYPHPLKVISGCLLGEAAHVPAGYFYLIVLS